MSGLSMYLTAEAEMWESSWTPKEAEAYDKIAEMLDIEAIMYGDHQNFVTVSVPIGFWHNAFGVHEWFVHNVLTAQGDCHSVHTDDLNKLLEFASKPDTRLSKAEAAKTVGIVENALKINYEDWSISYRAVWT